LDRLEETQKNVILDYLKAKGKRILPQKAAILRILDCKNKLTPDNPYVGKMTMIKILFESQPQHINDYLKDKLEDLINTDPEKETVYRIKNEKELPDEFVGSGISYDVMIETIQSIEKDVLTKMPQFKEIIKSIEDYVDLGLRVLADKYGEFFNKLSEKQLNELTESVRNRNFSRGLLYRLISKIIPIGDDFETRLILDALVYCTYCFVLGQKLNRARPETELSFIDYTNLVSRIVGFLMESQGSDGGWAFRNYDRAYIAKDTGMILFLLAEINEVFPNIHLDRSKLEKSESFLISVLQDMKKRKEVTIKVETEYFLQVSLYATLQTIAGLYSVRKILGGRHKETFEDKTVKSFFKHLEELESYGGYSLEKDNKPDVETTTFIVNTLIGANSFSLKEDEVRKLIKKFSSLGTINYFYNNRKTVEDFLNKGHHVNVVADWVSAMLWCGVWPFSAYLTDKLVASCTKSKKYMEDFSKKELFTIKNNQIDVSMGLRATYWKVMPAIHVLHQSILCLMVMYEYRKDPSTYWSRISHLLVEEEK
jgi:hypothetical protein